MTITLEVPPDMEAKLREYMAKHDPAEVQRELEAAFARTVALLMLVDGNTPLSDAEFKALSDELADHFERCASQGLARSQTKRLRERASTGTIPE